MSFMPPFGRLRAAHSAPLRVVSESRTMSEVERWARSEDLCVPTIYKPTAQKSCRGYPLQQLQQREASAGQIMKTLGGQSPDWYRSSQ